MNMKKHANPQHTSLDSGLAGQLQAAGLRVLTRVSASIEVPVWTLALELEVPTPLKPHEAVVLELVTAGVGDPAKLCALTGLTRSPAAVHGVLEALTALGLVERSGNAWRATAAGVTSATVGSRPQRIKREAQLTVHPSRGALVWALELRAGPRAGALQIVPRRPARGWPSTQLTRISELVATEGLAEGTGDARHSAVKNPALVSLSVQRLSMWWTDVELEQWSDARGGPSRHVLYAGGAEDVELTRWFEGGLESIDGQVARVLRAVSER